MDVRGGFGKEGAVYDSPFDDEVRRGWRTDCGGVVAGGFPHVVLVFLEEEVTYSIKKNACVLEHVDVFVTLGFFPLIAGFLGRR